MIPTLIAISSYLPIINLPPGDYFSTYIAELQARVARDLAKIHFLQTQYGLIARFGNNTLWVWRPSPGDMATPSRNNLPSPGGRRPLIDDIHRVLHDNTFHYIVAFPIVSIRRPISTAGQTTS